MANLQPGEHFVVSEIKEFRNGPALIARYLPEFTYRVTDKNAAFVNALFAEKKAFAPGEMPAGENQSPSDMSVAAARGRAAGSVSVKPKK